MTWRRARRLCIALVLAVVAFSAALRVRSFLLTRKIQAVVSGLQQLRPDVSVDADARRMVPSMTDLGAGAGVRPDEGIVRHYSLRLSNDDDWYWIVKHFPMDWPIDPYSREPRTSKWQSLSLPLWTAYVLGWRHIGFEADITVLNGVVSGIRYQIEPDVIIGWPAPYMVVVRSMHGVWGSWTPTLVGDVDDEAPDYRFGQAAGHLTWYGGAIGFAYTAEAPQNVVSHAYDVDLSCFWGLRGCGSARQVLPRLWEDREAVIRAAASRLASSNPCPDRVLAGRVRRLLELVVERREVTDPIAAGATNPMTAAGASRPGYRLKERLSGSAEGFPRFDGREGPGNYPQGFLWRRDPVAPSLKTGDEVLVFLGADFQSCRIVPATASAEAAVRTAVPAPRRSEDQPEQGRQ